MRERERERERERILNHCSLYLNRFTPKYYLNHGLTIKKALYYIQTVDFLKPNIADLLWKNHGSFEKIVLFKQMWYYEKK